MVFLRSDNHDNSLPLLAQQRTAQQSFTLRAQALAAVLASVVLVGFSALAFNDSHTTLLSQSWENRVAVPQVLANGRELWVAPPTASPVAAAARQAPLTQELRRLDRRQAKLEAEELAVRREKAQAVALYQARLRQAAAASAAAAAASRRQAADRRAGAVRRAGVVAGKGGEAQKVAGMVLGALQPELQAMESQIQRLSGATAPPAAAAPTARRERTAAPPRGPAAGRGAGKPRLGMKNLVDYGLAEGEPGEDVWASEAGRGGPCSVSGTCDHAPEGAPRFQAQDFEFYRDRFNSRFKQPPFEEPAEEEEEGDGEEAPEKVVLGDRALAMDLDDYVPPQDAYAHSLLTSGAEGYDHFGHMPPNSADNIKMLYGDVVPALIDNADASHKFLTPSRGGGWNQSALSRLGEDQIGHAEDEEVPVGISMPDVPGEDPDRFDHWPAASPQNQELVNGRLWREQARDGISDRFVPADEAYSQQSGASRDRHWPASVLGDLHHYGLDGEQSFAQAREEVAGPEWNRTVFVGTDEVIEQHKGVASNNLTFPTNVFTPVGGSYLKPARAQASLAAALAPPRPARRLDGDGAARSQPAGSFLNVF